MEIKEEIRNCEVCGRSEYTTICEKQPWTQTFLIKHGKKMFHKVDVMCNYCGVIYKNPMMTRDSQINFYKDAYLKLYEPLNVGSISTSSLALRVITTVQCLDWLESIGYDLLGKKVFEVGCGFGTLLMGMRSLGAEIDGVELCTRSHEIGEKIFGFKSTNASFEEIDISKQYDLVVINNSLEHFYSPKEILEKAKTMLLPGGKILVEVPSLMYPYPGITICGFLSSAHNFTFSKESFEYLANECGLKVEHMGYEGHKKCMLFLLSQDEINHGYVTILENTPNEIIQLYNEADRFVLDSVSGGKITKEMQTKKYSEMREKYPNHSNSLLLVYVSWLIPQGRFRESLDLIGNPDSAWKDNQSEDINSCKSTLHYFKGIVYRCLGDFSNSKKCLEEAMGGYPNFDKYNFISDMTIDGLVVESIFNPYNWYSCKKMLEQM
jgi:2-polyprenyl-3-methyl-5-hydroxy-6-metoxy-1,4-benzoquinol methylase